MLASEYILIDITLISYSPSFTNITELWNVTSALYLYSATVRAEVTQNISTAESPDVGCYTMGTFTTKYNYLILGLRSIFFLFFVGLFVGFFAYSVPKFIDEREFSFKMIVGMVAATFLVMFLCYRFLKLLRTQRKVLVFENDHLKVTYAIFKTERIIHKSEIKGFSLTTYPTKVWNFKEILIYLTNGEKIELPQFLYWNFKDFKSGLESNELKFLGFERFRWKFLDSRYYQFD